MSSCTASIKTLSYLVRHWADHVFWGDNEAAEQRAYEARRLVESLEIGEGPRLCLEDSVDPEQPVKRVKEIVIKTAITHSFEDGMLLQKEEYEIRLYPSFELGYEIEIVGTDILGAHNTLRTLVRSAIKR